MTKREELKVVLNEMNALQKMRDESYEKDFDLNVKRNELGLEILKEEKLLKNTKWDVWYYDGSTPYFVLNYAGDTGDKQFKKICELLSLNHHDRANINKDITLKINDNDASITFKNINALNKFITEYEMIVSCDDLREKIERYTNDTKELKEFIKKFNG